MTNENKTSVERPILATLVYLVRDRETLMIHRATRPGDWHSGKYNGLGGKLRPGETPLKGAIREVQEECGLELKRVRFKGHLLFPYFDPMGRDWLVFVYRGEEFTGALQPLSPEGEAVWISNDQILKLNLWEGDRHFLPHLHDNSIFEGKFLYKDGKLAAYSLELL
jgi:8-oxo-dGTP diphosphatase